MSCVICETVGIKMVKTIDRHLQEGKRSLLAIANRYDVDVGDLRLHMTNCVENRGQPQEANELVESQRLLRSLIVQCQNDIAGGKHLEFDPESGQDGRGLINQIAQLIREHREIVLAKNKIRTSEAIYQDLTEVVVGPLINALIQICTDEARRLREEMFDLTKSSQDQHPKIKKAVDEMLERVADRMAGEALHDIQDKVKAVAGQKKPGGRQAAH